MQIYQLFYNTIITIGVFSPLLLPRCERCLDDLADLGSYQLRKQFIVFVRVSKVEYARHTRTRPENALQLFS